MQTDMTNIKEFETPLLFEKYRSSGLYRPELLDAQNAEACSAFNEENLLPGKFRAILKKEMERLL